MGNLRRPIVAGNWKMNASRDSTDELLSALVAADYQGLAEAVVFPPFVYLSQAHDLLNGSSIGLGGQNLSEHDNGAYTGEISAQMLVDAGCQHVLIGHSERRSYYHDTDQLVFEKCQAALAAGLLPMVCIGETLAQREQQQTENVLNQQLELLFDLDDSQLVKLTIAYEPVWAIGTGLSATPEQAQAVHAFIRRQFAEKDEDIAKCLRILYGGSVKPDNAAALFAMPDIDGGLIGGASLNAQSFLDVIHSWSN